MALLGRDDILGAKDLKTERVAVPEWGEGAEVLVSEFTAEARDAFWEAVGPAGRTRAGIALKLAVLVLVDEQGHRLFGDADAEALGAKSAVALARIWAVGTRLNGLTVEVEATVEKNS